MTLSLMVSNTKGKYCIATKDENAKEKENREGKGGGMRGET